MSELNWKTLIEAAIKGEEQSVSFYSKALKNSKYPSSRVFFKQLVEQEKAHKQKLETILNDKTKISRLGFQEGSVQDLKIVDNLKDTPLFDEANYGTILVYAAKREKSSHDYYKVLALELEGTPMGEMFSKLAQEELTHKNKLEKEFDDCLLTEN